MFTHLRKLTAHLSPPRAFATNGLMNGAGTDTADAKGFVYTDLDAFTPVVRKKRKNRRAGNQNSPWTAAKVRSPTETVQRCMAELRADANWLEKCSRACIFSVFDGLPTHLILTDWNSIPYCY